MTDARQRDPGHPLEALQDLLDGRISPADEAAVRAHLASCERCRGEWARLERGRSAAGLLRTERDVPAGLASAIAEALDAENRRPDRADARVSRPDVRRSSGSRWAWAGGAAAAAVLVAALWWGSQPGGADTIPMLAARDFDAFTGGALSLEVETGEPAVLEAFFARGDAPRVRVLDLAMMGFTLDGGRRHMLGGRASALYVYRNAAGGRIVCQMYEGRIDDLPPTQDVRDNGGFRFHVFREGDVTLVFWQEGGIVCVLVSRLPAEDVVNLAFAKAMRPA